ncbi:MAG: SoxR reducing system RseC family protein [Clostridia bacterium]|nr:SoxR reducing system RseC family protein [Clostridia bacterium]
MMRKTGIVKTNGEQAEVAIIRESSCGENCASCKGGCTPSETIIVAENKLGAEVGDKVVLEMQDKNALTAAFIAYIIPLIVLIVASGLVSYFGYGDGMAALCGMGAMAVCFLAVRRISSIKADMFKVKIIDILG